MALTDQLLAWYRNNGTDTSGNGRNLSGSAGQGTGFNGVANGAIVFTGFGVLSRNAIFSTTSWSIGFWCKTPASNALFVKQLNNDFVTYIPYTSSGHSTAGFGKETEAGSRGSGGLTGATTGTGIPANTWLYYTATYDGTTVRLYKDAVEVATATVSLPAYAPNVNGFTLGQGSGSVPDAPYMQWVGCWSRALSAGEVSQLYNGGAGFDPTAAVQPVADFTGTPTSGTANLSVAFTDSSTNAPTSWLWEKNSGSGWVNFAGTPTAQNPTESFAAGTWSVRLTATNAGGSNTKTRTDYITAAAAGTAPSNLVPASVIPSSGTPATSFAFNAGTWTGTSGYPITYTWVYRKSGSQTWLSFSTSQNPIIPGTVFPTPATYDTQVTATNSFGSTTINGPSVNIGTTKPSAVNPLGYFGL